MKSMTELAGGELCLPQRPRNQVGAARRNECYNRTPHIRFSHFGTRILHTSSSSLACPIIAGIACLAYSALFVVLPSFSPAHVIFPLHASFHLRFGLPLLLLFHGMSTSSILLTMCSSFILLTWPYHFSRFSVKKIP